MPDDMPDDMPLFRVRLNMVHQESHLFTASTVKVNGDLLTVWQGASKKLLCNIYWRTWLTFAKTVQAQVHVPGREGRRSRTPKPSVTHVLEGQLAHMPEAGHERAHLPRTVLLCEEGPLDLAFSAREFGLASLSFECVSSSRHH